MTANSKIEWTDATWNPVVGCTRVSEGCRNCYAERMAQRLAAMGKTNKLAGRSSHKLAIYGKVVRDGRWNNEVRLVPEALDEPLHWKRPRKVFVCSMSDLFHDDVPFDFIDRVFAVMALCPQHTFQILTKRPKRMAEYFEVGAGNPAGPNPLPNVWLGTSCENQAAADERIQHLLRCPAAVRFLSCEPLLGPIELNADCGSPAALIAGRHWLGTASQSRGMNDGIDWVIVGGESGPGARPMHPDWARSIRDQCLAAGVPLHFKQWGAWVPKPYRDWENAQKKTLDKFVNVWRHGHLAKRVGRHRVLDGREWNEEPKGGVK